MQCTICRIRKKKRGYSACELCKIVVDYAVSGELVHQLRGKLRWHLREIEGVAQRITAGDITERDVWRSVFRDGGAGWRSIPRRHRRDDHVVDGQWYHAMAITSSDQIPIDRGHMVSFNNEPIYSNPKLLYGEKESMISIIKLKDKTPTDVQRFATPNEAAISLLKDGLKDEAYQLVTSDLTRCEGLNPVVALTENEELREHYFAKVD